MKTTQNKYSQKNSLKFTNWIKGKNDNKYFFLLPTITISPKKNLHWDMTIKSTFFGFGHYYVQRNVCEIVKDTSTEFTKEVYEKLLQGLNLSKLSIKDTKLCLEYMKTLPFITQVLRNSSIEHPYVRKLLYMYFHNQPFVSAI